MGNFIFRCSLPESTVISGMIKAAAELLKVKKIGILWGKEDTYTSGGYQAFMDAIKKQDLQVITDETFLRGDTDFKPQLSRIFYQQPDAIAVSAYVNEASLITIQARNLGFTGNILGGNGFNSSEFIKQTGAVSEGVVVGTAWDMAHNTPANTKFVSAFQKAYNSLPDQFAAQAYTGVLIYSNAIRIANSDEPRSIRDSLLKIRDFETPLGLFRFTEGREPIHSSAVQIIREGKFVSLN
jgi:branched-chain amino acid transport system substrate-binding protein